MGVVGGVGCHIHRNNLPTWADTFTVVPRQTQPRRCWSMSLISSIMDGVKWVDRTFKTKNEDVAKSYKLTIKTKTRPCRQILTAVCRFAFNVFQGSLVKDPTNTPRLFLTSEMQMIQTWRYKRTKVGRTSKPAPFFSGSPNMPMAAIPALEVNHLPFNYNFSQEVPYLTKHCHVCMNPFSMTG